MYTNPPAPVNRVANKVSPDSSRPKLRTLDLFSGIGGFALGLERTQGFETVAFCEINAFCRKVLAKHWPKVPCYEDIRSLTADALARDGIGRIDVICGGFPCQDVSVAGRRAGLDGARSGLWAEYARLVRALRPKYVIVENTPGLLSLGMGTVLGDLATLGYRSEFHSLPASCLGADHIRDRVWIIADDAFRCHHHHGQDAPDANGAGQLQLRGVQPDQREWSGDGPASSVADLDRARARWLQTGTNGRHAGSFGARLRSLIETAPELSREHWDHQPILGRGVHGVPHRVDRIAALGNAVFPPIVTLIGHAILLGEAS